MAGVPEHQISRSSLMWWCGVCPPDWVNRSAKNWWDPIPYILAALNTPSGMYVIIQTNSRILVAFRHCNSDYLFW